jgi:hypothetical protein
VSDADDVTDADVIDVDDADRSGDDGPPAT